MDGPAAVAAAPVLTRGAQIEHLRTRMVNIAIIDHWQNDGPIMAKILSKMSPELP